MTVAEQLISNLTVWNVLVTLLALIGVVQVWDWLEKYCGHRLRKAKEQKR